MVKLLPKLWLSSAYFQNIIDQAESFGDSEVGGVFMGYYADNDDVVVTDLIDHGDNAFHSRSTFIPDQDYQLKEIARLYEESNGNITYLGDWHSHPSCSPSLSYRDKRTLNKVANSAEAKTPNPIMLIVGSEPEKWTINCVQYKAGKNLVWPFFRCEVALLDVELFSE